MKFLIVSENGDSAGVAIKLQREGHEVFMFFRNAAARQTLKGIVPQVSSIRLGMQQGPDVVLFDMVGQGATADKLRESGWRVLGGGAWNDKLELDRKFSMKTMESLGIKSPRSYAFRNIRDAVDFVESHNKLLVLKPFDNKSTQYTFVPKTQDQLIGFMRHIKEDRGVDGRMLLQEYVDGTEVSTEVWYALGKPVPYPNSTFETKKLMQGDVGPTTGCQTSTVFSYPKREPKIVQQSLKKLSLFLERIRYTGPLDINGIVRKGKFWGLEFTPRFGYSAIYAWLRLLNEPLGDLLLRIAQGDASPMKVKEGFGYSLRASIPPYPYQPEDKVLRRRIYQETKNQAVSGLSKVDQEKVYFLDVYRSHGALYTAGFDGVVAEVTGYGQSAYEAEEEAVGLFRKLELPQKQARLGDGARIAERRMFQLGNQKYEVPPFEKPQVFVSAEVSVMPKGKEVRDVKKSNDGSTLALANKLNVRPGAFADPRVKSN